MISIASAPDVHEIDTPFISKIKILNEKGSIFRYSQPETTDKHQMVPTNEHEHNDIPPQDTYTTSMSEEIIPVRKPTSFQNNTDTIDRNDRNGGIHFSISVATSIP